MYSKREILTLMLGHSYKISLGLMSGVDPMNFEPTKFNEHLTVLEVIDPFYTVISNHIDLTTGGAIIPVGTLISVDASYTSGIILSKEIYKNNLNVPEKLDKMLVDILKKSDISGFQINYSGLSNIRFNIRGICKLNVVKEINEEISKTISEFLLYNLKNNRIVPGSQTITLSYSYKPNVRTRMLHSSVNLKKIDEYLVSKNLKI